MAAPLTPLFKTTPQDLVNGGLYETLAVSFVSGTAHRKLSHALLAKKLGAEAVKGSLSARLRSEMTRLSKMTPSDAEVEVVSAASPSPVPDEKKATPDDAGPAQSQM